MYHLYLYLYFVCTVNRVANSPTLYYLYYITYSKFIIYMLTTLLHCIVLYWFLLSNNDTNTSTQRAYRFFVVDFGVPACEAPAEVRSSTLLYSAAVAIFGFLSLYGDCTPYIHRAPMKGSKYLIFDTSGSSAKQPASTPVVCLWSTTTTTTSYHRDHHQSNTGGI
jgi:hypothetical protein